MIGLGKWRQRAADRTAVPLARWCSSCCRSAIVAGISLYQSADAIPPYTPLLSLTAGRVREPREPRQLPRTRRGLICAPMRIRSAMPRWRPCLCLLVGYPIAFAIARAPRRLAQPAVVSGDPAVLDQLPDPRLCLDRDAAADRPAQSRCSSRLGLIDDAGAADLQRFLGRARPRLLLSAVHDPAALRQPCRGSTKASSKPRPISARRHGAFSSASILPLSLPGIAAGALLGLHPGGRRVRDPRPLGGPGDADDRQGAVAGILRQCRLAGGVGGRDGAGCGADGAAACSRSAFVERAEAM